MYCVPPGRAIVNFRTCFAGRGSLEGRGGPFSRFSCVSRVTTKKGRQLFEENPGYAYEFNWTDQAVCAN